VLSGVLAVFAGGLAAPVALLGHGPLPATYAALAVAGCCGPAVTGGLTSRLATLAGPGGEARAFGLDSMFYNVAGVAGPALVGVVAAAAGPGAATLGLAAAAGLGAAGVATLPLPASQPAAVPARLFQGTRAVLENPPLRALTLGTAFGQLGPGALAVVATTLAAERAGLLLGVLAAGAFAGSLLWTWRPRPADRAPTVVAHGLERKKRTRVGRPDRHRPASAVPKT